MLRELLTELDLVTTAVTTADQALTDAQALLKTQTDALTAEVARQVDSAVRYAVRRATALEVGRLTIHVGGVRFGLDSAPPVVHPAPDVIGSRDLADSGTDVA